MHEGNFALQMAEMITAAPDAKAACLPARKPAASRQTPAEKAS